MYKTLINSLPSSLLDYYSNISDMSFTIFLSLDLHAVFSLECFKFPLSE